MDTDVAIFTAFDEEAPVTGLPEGDDCFPAIGAMFQRMTNPAQQRAVINLDGEASVMAVSAGGDPQSDVSETPQKLALGGHKACDRPRGASRVGGCFVAQSLSHVCTRCQGADGSCVPEYAGHIHAACDKTLCGI